MALPDSLQVALKEWAVVCDALARGRQMMLLRKGGIYEAAGEFEVEHRQFLLFPTLLHQKASMVKPEWGGEVQHVSAEPQQVILSAAAEVTDIIELTSRQQMDAVDEEHIWTAPLIDMRFNYRPENPLYLLLVRCFVLPESRTISNTSAYAGCKSWVPLDAAVPTEQAAPVLDDATFATRRTSILNRIDAFAR